MESRGPGRPRKAAGMSALEGIVTQIRELQRERDDLRRALGRMRDVIAGVV